MSYDEFDRVATKTVQCVETKEMSVWNYTYTANGKTKSLVASFPDGSKRTIKYSYDKLGRMESILDGQDKVKYSYDKKSMLASQEINGVPVTYSYTKYGQLESKVMGDVKNPIATLKYTYAKDGTITSREVNGSVQKYVYDAKNQLYKVVGADDKAVESYIYDNGGNILEKNINGESTKFTYDKANQLVSSVQPDGSVKKYAYDAAGRMISETADNSNKIYNYAWQDKVVSIDNNGAKVNFEYYPDGQLAQKITGKDTEHFYWDGLALMKRDSSEYTVEPAITGGNPIIADGKVLFNDLLGSSMGSFSDNKFNAINRNAFGQASVGSKANLDFFTGKPNIPELGYAFLFRNYRQDLGKWQTADPLAYPNGFNNFAYCNNGVISYLDPYGLTWYAITLSVSAVVVGGPQGSISFNLDPNTGNISSTFSATGATGVDVSVALSGTISSGPITTPG